jgi:transcriptional pleiotropic repressor
MDVLEANVYISSKKGKVLGTSYVDISGSPVIDKEYFPEIYIESMLSVFETRSNIVDDELIELFAEEIDAESKYVTIVPIFGSGKRLGTLLIAKKDQQFQEDDLVLAEYAASVVGMEIIRSERLVMEKNARDKAVVQISMETLSYSELDAMVHIFKELGGVDGLLVASKVADRVGITRSVIVNALRKLESAGVIESRSLGMKGTHIKILNEYLLDELYKFEK